MQIKDLLLVRQGAAGIVEFLSHFARFDTQSLSTAQPPYAPGSGFAGNMMVAPVLVLMRTHYHDDNSDVCDEDDAAC